MAVAIEDLLLKDGIITKEQLNEAKDKHKPDSGKDIEDVLVDLGFLDNQTMADYVMKALTA